ncbi:MAG: GTPase HflX [Pseudomonadota bacterium]
MTAAYSTETPDTRAWVLHPDIRTDRGRRDPDLALDEAVALAHALPGIDLCGQEVVPVPRARPGLLFGEGTVDRLRALFKAEEIGLVLIDGPVTPVQQRNLERAWGAKILDRTSLILEIFADRARTREGVLQVDQAALAYQRTRLVRAWTHLERQRGGLGFVGGPGETQIEADRRAIDEAITRLRRQLSKVVKTRDLHRAARKKVPYPVVALVGYTNAGKSTLFNRLTGAEVMAKDMLFATLDPTMRAIELPGGPPVILSDTVGFISNLPTELVAAFRATLEEVLSADLILHVRDIAHPETEAQAEDVRRILESLGVGEDRPVVEIWNKTDLLSPDAQATAEARAARASNVLLLSALSGAGTDTLLERLADRLSEPVTETDVTLSYADGRKRAWLFERGLVSAEHETDAGFSLSVAWTERQRMAFEAL